MNHFRQLFETYEALKAVDRHAAARASARSRGFNGSIGSSLPSRSENSSNSKYEEEDLARIAYLTSKVLHTLDEVIGDGGDPRLNSMKGAGRAGSQPLPLTQSQLATPPQKQQSSPFKQAVPQAAPPLSADSSPKPRRKDDSKRQQQHMYPPVADDGATQTTRAAGHSASEHASWQDDLRRFEVGFLIESLLRSRADTFGIARRTKRDSQKPTPARKLTPPSPRRPAPSARAPSPPTCSKAEPRKPPRPTRLILPSSKGRLIVGKMNFFELGMRRRTRKPSKSKLRRGRGTPRDAQGEIHPPRVPRSR